MFKAGDILGFSGASLVSDVINLATFGLPRWSISHVGILAEVDDRLLLVESTTLDRLPCAIQHKCVEGVQAHVPADVILAYRGRVWQYPLYRSLYEAESKRLTRFLLSKIGESYDKIGAYRAAGVGFSWLESKLHPENLHSLFCSELDAAAYREIGIMPCENAGRFNPNYLVRSLRRKEILLPPVRLK